MVVAIFLQVLDNELNVSRGGIKTGKSELNCSFSNLDLEKAHLVSVVGTDDKGTISSVDRLVWISQFDQASGVSHVFERSDCSTAAGNFTDIVLFTLTAIDRISSLVASGTIDANVSEIIITC